jgi:hypothetical protein
MIWRFLLELSIFILVPLLALTQILIPVWRGRRTFPIFRGRSELITELDKARSDVGDAELELDIHRTRREADRIRKPLRREDKSTL